MKIPELFETNMREILAEEYPDFRDSLEMQPVTAIRLNPLKSAYLQFAVSDSVPWCNAARYVETRPTFTTDPYFHAGHYYVQDASSMIILHVLQSLNVASDSQVLDLCAAPGGKSTLLSHHIADTGIIHSHEYSPLRAETLKQNIIKWGHPQYLVTSGNVRQLCKTGSKYDLILIDAPCSGEGMLRKERDALLQWNSDKIYHCKKIQSELIKLAAEMLKAGGIIIYTTCTFNREENENVCREFTTQFPFENVRCNFPPEWNIHESDKFFTYRLMPHRVKGEGITISVLKSMDPHQSDLQQKEFKRDAHAKLKGLPRALDCFSTQLQVTNDNYSYIMPHLFQKWKVLTEKGIRTSYAGIQLGHYKGQDWFMDHALSQSVLLPDSTPAVSLNDSQSLDYLRALEPNYLSLESTETWHVAKYEHANLGWLKNNHKKWKNYLPKNLRIISY